MVERRNPYFKFYPSDFMGGVRGLTAQEVGAYTMLLCRMYEEDGPIQDDTFRLSAYCGMREATFASVLEKLVRLGKIERANGRLFNDRAGREISSRADGLEIAIRAGRISAEKRQQNQGKVKASVQRKVNHTDTDTDTDYKEEVLADKPPPKKRACQLPDGWVPSAKNTRDAEAKGFSAMEIENEADRFRDFHTSKGSTFKCWDAAWRTWLGNARKFAATGKGNSRANAATEQISIAARFARSSDPDCF